MDNKIENETLQSTSMRVAQEFTMSISQVLKINNMFEANSCGIKYLNSINASSDSFDSFTKDCETVMTHLNKQFSTSQYSYQPWLRFLDVAYKMTSPFFQKIEEYKNKIGNIIRYVLLNNQNRDINSLDWRLLRKLIACKDILPESMANSIQTSSLILQFEKSIDQSLKYLIWAQENTPLVEFARETLMALKEYCKDDNFKQRIINSIINGRFAKKSNKKTFNQFDKLLQTLILGEDGGLYALLNSTQEKFKSNLQRIAGKQYLREKTSVGKSGKENKVILGKGSFGKVRFALSIFYTNKYPGELVCVKKTSNMTKLANGSNGRSAEEVITSSTLDDYFASQTSQLIYSPKVLDMSLIFQDPDRVEMIHQKGYLFMQIVPQNTATNIFAKSKFQKWEYQKPYLIDVFEKVGQLLKNQIAFTDLKPDNSLFNIYNRKAFVIDLGGTVKANNLTEYSGSYQYTKQFSAPQIVQKAQKVNLISTVSFGCGEIVNWISKNTNCDKNPLKNLINRLKVDRISLDEGLKQLQNIGNSNWKQSAIFFNYVNKIEQRLQKNKSSIFINQDIQQTSKTFIPLFGSKDDPYKYSNIKTYDLKKELDLFLTNKDPGVFLLLGRAGAGKSVVLQQKFIQCIHEWNQTKPLPIFFNLSNNIFLDKIISSMDDQLGTNLSKNITGRPLLLFIDSFDEGLDIQKYQQTLIKDIIKSLSNEKQLNVKIILSCRSDYLQDDSSDEWFRPRVGIFQKMYITSFDSITVEKWNEYVKNWCKIKNKQNKFAICIDKVKKFKEIITTGFIFQIIMEVFANISQNLTNSLSKIEVYRLYIKIYIQKKIQHLSIQQRKYIKESFLITNPPTLLEDRISQIGGYLAKQLHLKDKHRLKEDDYIFKMLGYRPSEPIKIQKIWHTLRLLPLKIQTKCLSSNKFTYKQEIAVGFIHDTIKNHFLLQEIKKEFKSSENSSILSSRSITDDYELLGLLRDTVQSEKDPQFTENLRKMIFATKSNKAPEYVTASANAITILVAAEKSFTAEDLSNISIKGANLRNGIFQYTNFSNSDLSGVKMTNINISGSKFIGTNMSEVDFSMNPCIKRFQQNIISLVYAPNGTTFACGLQNGDIIVYYLDKKTSSTLKGHQKFCYALKYSQNSLNLVSGSHDKTVRIWNLENCSVIKQFKFGAEVYGLCYSANEKRVIVGGDKNEVVVFDVESGKELGNYKIEEKLRNVISICHCPVADEVAFASCNDQFFINTIIVADVKTGKVLFHTNEKDNHRNTINWLCYSPNGKYLASCSDDLTIKIWQREKKYTILKTLQVHNEKVSRICFSPDSKFIASGSYDKVIKITDVDTCTVVKDIKGHRGWIISVCYSSDGRYILSGGGDFEVRKWNAIASETVLQNLPKNRSKLYLIGYKPNSKYLAAAFYSNPPTIQIYNMQTLKFEKQLILELTTIPQVMTISTDFSSLIYTCYGNIFTYNFEKGQTKKKQNGDQMYLCFSKDCHYALSRSITEPSKVDFKIWLVQSNKIHFQLHKEQNQPWTRRGSFSFDNSLLAVDRGKTTLRIYNVADKAIKNTLQLQSQLKLFEFDKTAEKIITVENPQEMSVIKVWNVQSGELLNQSQNPNYNINSISFLTGASKIFLCYDNNYVQMFDFQKNCLVHDLSGHNGKVFAACFCDDKEDSLISASEDSTVRLWKKTAIDKEERWCLFKNIVNTQCAFKSDYTVINSISGISDNNLKVFEQKYVSITNTNSVGKGQPYNPKILDNQLARYRQKAEADFQKGLQIKQVEINIDSILNCKQQSQFYRPPELSFEVGAAVPLIKKETSNNQTYQSYSGGGGGSYESDSSGCCCVIYRAQMIYDNPLLNIKDGVRRVARMYSLAQIEVLNLTADNYQLALAWAREII